MKLAPSSEPDDCSDGVFSRFSGSSDAQKTPPESVSAVVARLHREADEGSDDSPSPSPHSSVDNIRHDDLNTNEEASDAGTDSDVEVIDSDKPFKYQRVGTDPILVGKDPKQQDYTPSKQFSFEWVRGGWCDEFVDLKDVSGDGNCFIWAMLQTIKHSGDTELIQRLVDMGMPDPIGKTVANMKWMRKSLYEFIYSMESDFYSFRTTPILAWSDFRAHEIYFYPAYLKPRSNGSYKLLKEKNHMHEFLGNVWDAEHFADNTKAPFQLFLKVDQHVPWFSLWLQKTIICYGLYPHRKYTYVAFFRPNDGRVMANCFEKKVFSPLPNSLTIAYDGYIHYNYATIRSGVNRSM